MAKVSKLLSVYRNVWIVGILSIIVYMISSRFDALEFIVNLSTRYEKFEIDEFVTVAIFLSIVFGLMAFKKSLQLSKQNEALISQKEKLLKALDEIKILEGILPICSYCKKIENENGEWQQVELYIHRNTEADFSHGACPDCAEKHYGDLLD
jgi:hypothetical protein